MRYLSYLNRKKLLGLNILAYIVLLLTILSFYNLSLAKASYLDEGRQEISDGTEYRLVAENVPFTDALCHEIMGKYVDLDLPAELNRVDIADLRAVKMIAQLYGWDFANADVAAHTSLYDQRDSLMKAFTNGKDTANDEFAASAEKIAYPIEMGYAEGWKNIHSGMRNCVLAVFVILFFLFVPVFNRDKAFGMDGLIRSTKAGERVLDSVRAVNVLLLSCAIYLIAVAIYVTPLAIVYGIDGANLPIQGDPPHFLSPVGVSYLGQFAFDLLIGFVAVVGVAGIAMLVSAIIRDVFVGYAALLFAIAASYMAENFASEGFKHIFWSFTFVGMTDFDRYYIGQDTYWGISALAFIPLIAAGVIVTEYSFLVCILRSKARYLNNLLKRSAEKRGNP